MPEMQNFKRKRANRSSYVVNPDGNCTPSDSETDDDESDRFNQRKIVRRRQSSDNDVNEVELNDGNGRSENSNENSNHSNGTDSTESQWSHGNSQLLYAALEKLQELESELAELDEADYDSGHHDDDDDYDDIDEGNDSDIDEQAQQQQQRQPQHDHRNDILDGEAEALGFAFCVKETFEYLAAQGVAPDNPIIASLRERFLGQCNDQLE